MAKSIGRFYRPRSRKEWRILRWRLRRRPPRSLASSRSKMPTNGARSFGTSGSSRNDDHITAGCGLGATSGLADLREVAVSAQAILETGRALDTISDQRFASIVPFLDQRIAHAEAMALECGASVGADANLRESCDFLRHLF